MTGLVRCTLVLMVLLAWTGPALADEPNRVGLVVQFDDGRIETRCVPFEGEEISGADLLARSGLQAVVDTSSGMGVIVCQIGGEGCAFPAEPCFCQCMGSGECAYWNYFTRDPDGGGWTYSALGAAVRKARPGSLEGWVWGDGRTPPAEEVTFESVCPALTTTPTSSPQPASPTSASATATPGDTPSPAEAPATLPTATPPLPSPAPAAGTDRAPSLTSYWPFGILVLGLTVVGVLVWLRRR